MKILIIEKNLMDIGAKLNSLDLGKKKKFNKN